MCVGERAQDDSNRQSADYLLLIILYFRYCFFLGVVATHQTNVSGNKHNATRKLEAGNIVATTDTATINIMTHSKNNFLFMLLSIRL